jgi:feruloyl-CoA synthase
VAASATAAVASFRPRSRRCLGGGEAGSAIGGAADLAEEFKLGSGPWVSGGQLRAELLRRLAPLVDELVLCGEGHTNVGMLAWPNRAALESAGAAGLQVAIRERLAAHNAANPGASTSVRRMSLLQEPPNAAAHELSDKGTVNRSAVLTRRAADVERLYAEPPTADVIEIN